MADPALNIPAYRQPGALDRYNSERVTGGSLLRDAWDGAMNWALGGNLLNDQISRFNLNADETMALIHQNSPESQKFLDVIAGNDRVKQAFFGAAQRDGDFLNDLKGLMASGSGFMSPEQMEKALQQPGAADALAKALDNVGKEINGKKVGVADIKNFADASQSMAESMDPNFMKGESPDVAKKEREARRKAWEESMKGVGVETSVVTSAYGQKAGMDIFKKMLSGDTRGALSGMEDLMTQGGMDPVQVQALMQVIGPIMGLTSEFLKPYAQFAQFYGPQFSGWLNSASGGKIDLAAMASGEAPKGDRVATSASAPEIKAVGIDLGATFTAEHNGAGNGYKPDTTVKPAFVPPPAAAPSYDPLAFG